jgi:RimJ/RimL family protein N-acetyltransferase
MGRHFPLFVCEQTSPMMSPTTDLALRTDRLTLRPFTAADAPVVQALCGNWNVARMLAVIPYPYPDGLAENWISGHAEKRARGAAYIFAIEHEGALIGSIGLERRSHRGDDAYELGYWIAEDWWGRGLASEAAARMVRFALDELGAPRLTSGHFNENPASGRVLEKCGFRVTGTGELPCAARGHPVASTLLERAADIREPAR